MTPVRRGRENKAKRWQDKGCRDMVETIWRRAPQERVYTEKSVQGRLISRQGEGSRRASALISCPLKRKMASSSTTNTNTFTLPMQLNISNKDKPELGVSLKFGSDITDKKELKIV